MSTSVFTTRPCDICAKGFRVGNRYFITVLPGYSEELKEYTGIQDCCSIECVRKLVEHQAAVVTAQTDRPKVHFHSACEQCGKVGWDGLNYEVIIRGPANDLEALYLCSPACVVDWVADNNNDDSLYEDDWEEEEEFEGDDEEFDDEEDEEEDDD